MNINQFKKEEQRREEWVFRLTLIVILINGLITVTGAWGTFLILEHMWHGGSFLTANFYPTYTSMTLIILRNNLAYIKEQINY